MSRHLLDALTRMTASRCLLSELASHPALGDDLVRRIVTERRALAELVDEITRSTQAPAIPALVDHVMRQRGCTERVAMIEIRKRRTFYRCEWCGTRPPEAQGVEVMACRTCRESIPTARVDNCSPTDHGGEVSGESAA